MPLTLTKRLFKLFSLRHKPGLASPPFFGELAMTTLISWKTLSKMQPYSRQHWKRLEDDGRVPKRVRLGRHRVAWVLSEIQDWQLDMLRKRDEQTP